MNLKEYIDKEGIIKKKFCANLGISHITLDKILNGSDLKLSLAWEIVKATNSKVSLHDLYDAYIDAHPSQDSFFNEKETAKPKKKK